jgi:hypothetical protein
MNSLSKIFGILKSRTGSLVNDHRASKRYDLPLKLNYYDPIAKCRRESLTKNISRVGLRFPIIAKIPKGTVLDLKIEDPYSNAQISSKAKIIWTEEFTTGDDAGSLAYEVGVKLLRKRLWN